MRNQLFSQRKLRLLQIFSRRRRKATLILLPFEEMRSESDPSNGMPIRTEQLHRSFPIRGISIGLSAKMPRPHGMSILVLVPHWLQSGSVVLLFVSELRRRSGWTGPKSIYSVFSALSCQLSHFSDGGTCPRRQASWILLLVGGGIFRLGKWMFGNRLRIEILRVFTFLVFSCTDIQFFCYK